jgi:glycosyltransferase involved in cell wall biosynthesis
VAAAGAWVLAGAWVVRTVTAARRMREVPNLRDWPADASEDARLAVVVPALNEEAAVEGCLRSLLASQGVRLEIVAVDDRSTDRTGALMDAVAAEVPGDGPHTLRVIHIEELPEGWLGKPHALSRGARATAAPWVLFTDADAWFAPDALARSLAFVEAEAADHFVLLPTLELKTPGERMLMGAINTFAVWGVRLWKIADPGARDYLGVGCFNLLRRSAYDRVGGFERLRMEVLEDLRMGYLVKSLGLRQRVAFGAGLVRVHWAAGALGIVRTMEKNLFAVWRYQVSMLLGALGGFLLLTLGPWVGLLGPRAVRVPSAVGVGAMLAAYVGNARRSGNEARYAGLMPVASVLLAYAMVRSAAVTLHRGGVEWRGTFYPLAELRAQSGRLWWWQVPSRTIP